MQIKLQNTLKQISNNLLAALLLIAATLIATTSAFAENTKTDAVSGYVTITTASGEVIRSKSGDILKEGDTVTTGEGSSVSIILADGTIVNIGELSSYTIGESEAGKFASRSISSSSPTLSTATSAGGGITDEATTPSVETTNESSVPVTPSPGGSPSN